MSRSDNFESQINHAMLGMLLPGNGKDRQVVDLAWDTSTVGGGEKPRRVWEAVADAPRLKTFCFERPSFMSLRTCVRLVSSIHSVN